MIAISASCTHLEPASEPSGSSRTLELNDGGAFGDQERFLLSQSELVAETYRYSKEKASYVLKEQNRIALDPRQSERLWLAVSQASIETWQPRYEPSQLGTQIYDGIQWNVELVDGDQVYRSSGDNTYPSRRPMGAPTLKLTNTYSRLLRTLEAAASERGG